MKAYFLMILGTAVLSALSSMMTPEKWRSYVRLVTGMIILACAALPITDLLADSGGFEIPEISSSQSYDENAYANAVADELRRRVEEDIEARMKREYNADIRARAEININDKNEIEGIERITVRGQLSETAKRELCGIYGVDMIYEE